MDINETYAQLRLAMAALGVEGGTPAPETCRRAFGYWDQLDRHMRQSGFPPVVWNNSAAPAEVGTNWQEWALKQLEKPTDLEEAQSLLLRTVEQQRTYTRDRDIFMGNRPYEPKEEGHDEG